MPKILGLTDIRLRKAKPSKKPYKLFDSGGLYLLIHPNGSAYWQVKYRHFGKEKTLSLGTYPIVSIKEARNRRDEAKKLINQGVDPSALKQQEKQKKVVAAANSFEAVGREWFEKNREEWTPDHAERIMRSLEKDVFPALGKRPIEAIEALEVLSILRKVEKRDALDVAKRLRQRMGAVFRYAVQTSRIKHNPIPDLEGAIKTRKVQHRRFLPPSELPAFLHALEGYGQIITKYALQLLILTFVRSGEIRGAQWKEFDFQRKEWRIPAERMKMNAPHIVPLSKQALAVLKNVHSITGENDLVFSIGATGTRMMSENTMLFAIKRLGFKDMATVHGFRGLASTVLNENGIKPDVIERQLAHAERSGVRAAYNHAEYLPERHTMMAWWGSYVEKAGEKKHVTKNRKT